MSALVPAVQRLEFEARLFVSLGIVLAVCAAAGVCFPTTPPLIVLAGAAAGIPRRIASPVGYAGVAAVLAVASGLRMWAGSALTSERVMAFHVRADALTITGPYHLVRNPIYLADLIAFTGFALCLPPVGIALPVLLLLHYAQLIRHEERALLARFGGQYRDYAAAVPAVLPDRRSLRRLRTAATGFTLTADGVRHNALYVLFIPGFALAARSGSLLLAVAVGLPAVLDWALVHARKGLPRARLRSSAVARPPAPTRRAKVFDGVLYAQCWEDPEVDREALQIGPDDVVFSITSGGDNVLAFLLDDPRRVVALDRNPHQNYLLDLKMAAFARLSYAETLALLGLTPSAGRRGLYRSLRYRLAPESRDYWDANLRLIDAGVIHGGRYERYLRLLRWWFAVVMGRALAREIVCAPSPRARRAVYARGWDTRRWRAFTTALLSRAVMTRLFDPVFFAQLEETISFGERFRRRIERAVLELPVERNPFLSYALLGRYPSAHHLPVYLRPEHYDTIRRRVDRVEWVTASCEDYFAHLPADTLSKFNFSNVFEWMPPSACERVLRDAVRVARDGAVMTYRNLLVPRSRPLVLARWIRPDRALAGALHARDLSFIYGAYVVERIRKDGVPCPIASTR